MVQTIGVCEVIDPTRVPTGSSTCGVTFTADAGPGATANPDAGVNDDAGAPASVYGPTMYGSAGNDDDCKYYLSKPVDADQIIAALTSDAARPAPEAPPTLARAEWEHIQRVLADCHHNISESARRLGITRRTLQLKLKKYPPRS